MRACCAPGFAEVSKTSSEVFNSLTPHAALMDQDLGLSRQRVAGTSLPAPEPRSLLSAVRVGPPHRVHWGQRDPGADAQTDRRHGAGQSMPTIKGNSPLSPSHPALLAGETPGGPDQFDFQDSLLALWGPEFKRHLFALIRMPSPVQDLQVAAKSP